MEMKGVGPGKRPAPREKSLKHPGQDLGAGPAAFPVLCSEPTEDAMEWPHSQHLLWLLVTPLYFTPAKRVIAKVPRHQPHNTGQTRHLHSVY